MLASLQEVDGQAWECVDFISDLHLQAGESAGLNLLQHYLQQTPAQAVFILGDFFEVWVGDDLLDHSSADFERCCVKLLSTAAEKIQLFWMVGNRDFLTGQRWADEARLTVLNDPSVLRLNQHRVLLSHGDMLCLNDHAYQQFRSEVRSKQWQTNFLALPIEQRIQLASDMRAKSKAYQSGLQASATAEKTTDVDDSASRSWLLQTDCSCLIHGHTHQPADHDLKQGLIRRVLSDWHTSANRLQAQVLRWQSAVNQPAQSGHWSRIDLAALQE